MKFSVMFWNIWLDNQIQGPQNSQKLLKELKRVVEEYQPDYIGLNEVLQNVNESSPFITDFLKTLGYKYTYFAQASPFTKDWLIGTALSSKYKPKSIKAVEMGKDTAAERRGYPGHTVKAISAVFQLSKNRSFNLMIAHPSYLSLHTVKDHYQHTSTLKTLLKGANYSQNTIIGGDFNEPRFMPRSFKKANKNILYHRSGTFKSPTWRHMASTKTILRANLDRLFWTKKGSIKLLKFKVVGTDASDHRPIFAIFESS